MRHYTLYNIYKTLFLAAVMLAGVVESAWGQEPQTEITKKAPRQAKPITIIPHATRNSVHTRTQIVYVDEKRELYVPELRINYEPSYNWYVHWYVEGEGDIAPKAAYIDGEHARIRGGDFEKTSYTTNAAGALVSDGASGFVWAEAINNAYLGIDASTIEYTLPAGFTEGKVICDISNNLDDKLEGTTYHEPTLMKRYEFIIKPVEECVNNPREIFQIDYPADNGERINFSMPSLPQNYYWKEGSSYIQGEKFAFSTSENGPYEDFYLNIRGDGKEEKYALPSLQVQQVSLSEATTIYVKAKKGDKYSHVLAEFRFNPVQNSGFLLDGNIPDERKPELNEKMYEQIAFVDFDVNDVTSTEPTELMNVSANPLPIDETVYGFLRKDIKSTGNNTSIQNQYGLFRMANNTSVSTYCSDISKKWVLWISKFIANAHGHTQYKDAILYDRTYERTRNESEKKYGYFYYIDASDDPGTLVDVKINGIICGYTELVVTAWLADMTRPCLLRERYPLAPNINLVLKGKKENGEEIVLHRFTSGDALTQYSDEDNSGLHGGNVNTNLMKWQQLCYKIAINEEEIEGCTDFHLEVQNNEPHTDGADYAIDDVRIYMSKPHINVSRESTCDASTLVVASDYATLMRNMGWNIKPNVLEGIDLTDPQFRKYRYGLMGPDPYASVPNSYVGNAYYGATDQFTTSTGAELQNWVTLSKNIENIPGLERLSKNIRVTVPTELYGQEEGTEQIPTDKETALRRGIVMNIRAINDFISDTGNKKIIDENGDEHTLTIWDSAELEEAGIKTSELIEGLKKLNVEIVKDEGADNDITGRIVSIPAETIDAIGIKGSELNKTYEQMLLKIYAFLGIPRIHCSWTQTVEGEKMAYLGAIDVDNTDLKFKGEKKPNAQEGEEAASGEYEVILFSARAVVEAAQLDPTNPHAASDVVSFNNPCLLHATFIVQPSFTIAVDATSTSSGTACEGSIAKVTATLWVEKVDELGNLTGGTEEFEKAYADRGGKYTFDWYLGGRWQYEQEKRNVQALLKDFRDSQENTTSSFTKEAIMEFYKNDAEAIACLQTLLGDSEHQPKLVIGNGASAEFFWTDSIMAIPYVPNITSGENGYEFCTEPQDRALEAYVSPGLSVGFPNVAYPMSNVPLRLGLKNIKEQKLENIPIQNNQQDQPSKIIFGSGGSSLGMPYGENASTTIFLFRENEQDLIPVAELTALQATADGGTLSLIFNEDIPDGTFKEDQTYSLSIPFGEYQDTEATQQILGSCAGYTILRLKIVPEYLTWHGEESDNWYNDKNLWKISTSDELYKKVSNTASTPTFSPLYFTNITIPGESNPLSLIAETYKGTGDGKILELNGDTDFQYDMAVNSKDNGQSIYISSYYGNKVNQIYFKPEATLTKQHLLDYQKAWVEFEIDNGERRWMASPLQNVYAGDFYAPTGETLKGRQETPAFTPITYKAENGATYSRWAPAFYQKAWNSAIQYANDKDGTDMTALDAVANNWSIEYNNVTVKYPIGKGFYLSVEDVPGDGIAMVRLPKEDLSYNYEAKTKAASLTDTPRDTNQGKLAGFDTEGKLTIALSDEIYQDTEKSHFLVGNPAMAYLDMEAFFTKNNSANQSDKLSHKYWTLRDGVFSATVDEGFEDGNDVETIGLIAPMEAFFVEAPEGSDIAETGITFTSDMFVHANAAAGMETKASAFSASNPTISLIAERGDMKSIAKLTTRDNADNGYEVAEDAIAMIDSELNVPIVYTVSGSKAAQVNAVKSINNIGLGVYNDKGDEVTLTIEGLDRLAEPLYLYDASTRKSTLLEGDSYSLRISGDNHGRYFLRDSSLDSELENAISIYSAQAGKVIVSSTRPVKNIRVISLNGSQVRQFSVNTTQYSFDLPAGIYMIYASDGEQEQTEKVVVR